MPDRIPAKLSPLILPTPSELNVGGGVLRLPPVLPRVTFARLTIRTYTYWHDRRVVLILDWSIHRGIKQGVVAPPKWILSPPKRQPRRPASSALIMSGTSCNPNPFSAPPPPLWLDGRLSARLSVITATILFGCAVRNVPAADYFMLRVIQTQRRGVKLDADQRRHYNKTCETFADANELLRSYTAAELRRLRAEWVTSIKIQFEAFRTFMLTTQDDVSISMITMMSLTKLT
ncbi:hypothetical protein NM688_g4985 [Phlebia brevispora]|uniref:Uncharacterized protein n=1 Tax=Phlebia brevispora TaxID=194682 RepID=A0ACC1T1H7_9APHY|nr:hypothetical protein NM688_g4985 [Phlebia brevispora]